MGFVITIKVCSDWERTYFVQSMDEQEAKEKTFKMFRQTMSCWIPDTLQEAEEADEGFYMEVLAIVDQIII